MLNMHVVFMDFSVTKLKLEHINVQYLYICNDVFTFGDDDVVKQKLLNCVFIAHVNDYHGPFTGDQFDLYDKTVSNYMI